jgi:rhodanese-related sulfurtransferase
MLERGLYVSFANCGLPYYVGNLIGDGAKLLIADPTLFRDRFNVDVRTEEEVIAIGRPRRQLTVRRTRDGTTYALDYDKLVLSPGARPLLPALPGIDLPGIFSIKTAPDSSAVREWIETRSAKSADVIGGGFIGLEMAENLTRLGIDVVILDVRDDDEVACKPIPGEIHITLNQLRQRLDELPIDRPIQICCAVGARAYTASRLLTQHGFAASLLSGGAETWFCVENSN